MKEILGFMLMIFSFNVIGHDGHGSHMNSYLHYLTSWVHLLPILILLIGGWFLIRTYGRQVRGKEKNKHA